jgi:hypothetical protein
MERHTGRENDTSADKALALSRSGQPQLAEMLSETSRF